MLANPKLGWSRCIFRSKPTPSSRTQSSNPSSNCLRDTSAVLACAWRPTFRSASWATRNKQSEICCDDVTGPVCSLTSTGIDFGIREPLTLRLQCIIEPEVIENRRMQSIGKRMNIFAQPDQSIARRYPGRPRSQVVLAFASHRHGALARAVNVHLPGSNQSPAKIAGHSLRLLAHDLFTFKPAPV